ncbi:MAG: hypothetical protein KC457_09710 [Myxococcales bacterium]|nr:hypothetical protein [Myxococcales bacterium]
MATRAELQHAIRELAVVLAREQLGSAPDRGDDALRDCYRRCLRRLLIGLLPAAARGDEPPLPEPIAAALGTALDRALELRELGTLYECLLDYELDDHGGVLQISAGSGARKQAGAYFTSPLLIDHLLDHTLEPALDDHLRRLESLGEAEATAALLDFEVIDLAMGAGHFLLAALERISARLAEWLKRRPLAALAGEDLPRLRRRIAQRCLYGVDLDGDVVALARACLRAATSVGGQLVVGNALIGIGDLAEAEALLQARGRSLPTCVDDLLRRAARLRAEDAAGAEALLRPVRALFDVLCAARIGDAGDDVDLALTQLERAPAKLWNSPAHRRALATLAGLAPFHFPTAFPERFIGTAPGFCVLVGNPPWEEALVEEDRFWSRYARGLQSLPQGRRAARIRALARERPDRAQRLAREIQQAADTRRALLAGDYPGMSTGDADLYKAFCWRVCQLAGPAGRVGLVLPIAAFTAKGSSPWRRALLSHGRLLDLTFLSNRRGWVFADVHPQTTIALASFAPRQSSDSIPLRGPFADESEYRDGREREPERLELAAVLEGTDSAAFPLLPSPTSAAIWARMRRAPRLDLCRQNHWRARPHRELDATNDKAWLHFGPRPGPSWWPVYKGESFDLWDCDTGSYYGWVDPAQIREQLQARRSRARKSAGPFGEFTESWLADPSTLPCLHPRIVFRDVSRATDSRTVRAALIPPERVVANQAPYLLWPRGDARDQAYLLGVLCSLPLDWYARCFVDKHLNYHLFNPLPIPRPAGGDRSRARVVAIAGRLAAQDQRLHRWAEQVEVDCGPLADDEQAELIAELDAVVARLYGLDEAQLVHLFESFHRGWDPEPRLTAVRRHFARQSLVVRR